MPIHEDKRCPRCSNVFECKAGSIAQCDCSKIVLSLEERAFIEDKYKDCLCLNCLKDLKNKYVFFKEKYFG
ncbi:cysteine-rich CWC family protein [Chitinophagaceae bacterium LB-8]|uniref:Cysteine-rich CWC family protein n=2 Tax=Paraflavisolibacter caeni TaxID=2982496 RepID=A0A9X2XZT4_9BACT|nr:cysteine-rich CWC family protein [Paraflavisolibacter caeni]MCU7551732.1 cysteine-rich CWC family protein [Paraflavisolibacter caeni]